jgi:hypothetical protein
VPVKKRKSKQTMHPITPDATAAFQAGEAMALHRALGLRPWEISPLECAGACTYPAGTGGAESWPQAQAMQAELIRRILSK